MVDRFGFAPLGFTGDRWSPDRRATAPGPAAITVQTWNVWFGEHRLDVRQDALLAELARRRADVIALQEVTPRLLAGLMAAPWLRAEYQLSELEVIGYDVAIVSRLPIRRMAVVAVPSALGRRLVIAELACGLEVATIHLESTAAGVEQRVAQLAIIQTALAEAGRDVVLAGDFNFAPEDEVESSALDPSFVDVWPRLRPVEPGYTIDGERNRMRIGSDARVTRRRIDRVFVRGSRWRPTSIELLGTDPIDGGETWISDHFGLEVRLEHG